MFHKKNISEVYSIEGYNQTCQKRKVVLSGYYHYYHIHLKPYNHLVQSNRKLLNSPIFLVSESDMRASIRKKKALYCFIRIEPSVIGLVVSALWDS